MFFWTFNGEPKVLTEDPGELERLLDAAGAKFTAAHNSGDEATAAIFQAQANALWTKLHPELFASAPCAEGASA